MTEIVEKLCNLASDRGCRKHSWNDPPADFGTGYGGFAGEADQCLHRNIFDLRDHAAMHPLDAVADTSQVIPRWNTLGRTDFGF